MISTELWLPRLFSLRASPSLAFLWGGSPDIEIDTGMMQYRYHEDVDGATERAQIDL